MHDTVEHLFITDRGTDDASGSVVKLKVESAEIIWRTSLDCEPDMLRHVGGRLYITHLNSAMVTVMSAENGSIIRTIIVRGVVKEMRESPHAEVEMVCYE